MVNPLQAMNIHLKNRVQECKTNPIQEWILLGGGGGVDRVKET
jgi:hypothetical protein